MTDYHNNTTTYTYTDRDELSTLTAPGWKTWTFHHNDIGQPTYYNIPNGMTTNYTYDSRNRLTAIEHKDGANVLDGFYYDLDSVGNITATTNEDGSFWEYEYDGRYRLTSAVRKSASENIAATYAHTYDDGDNMLSKVEPFEDDFNDGDYTGWSVWSGTWSAANNYLHMNPGTSATIAESNTDNDLKLRFTYACNDTNPVLLTAGDWNRPWFVILGVHAPGAGATVARARGGERVYHQLEAARGGVSHHER